MLGIHGVDFFADNTNNNPLVITPLGRAQMNLSSLLSGQVFFFYCQDY